MRSCSGAGGRSGLGADGVRLRLRRLLRGLDFGTDDDLRLLLAENYCLTTNDFTTELTGRTETFEKKLLEVSASLSMRCCVQQRPAAAHCGCLARIPAASWLAPPHPRSGGWRPSRASVHGGTGSHPDRLYEYSKPLTLNLANPVEKALLALVFWLSGWHQYIHHDVN